MGAIKNTKGFKIPSSKDVSKIQIQATIDFSRVSLGEIIKIMKLI